MTTTVLTGRRSVLALLAVFAMIIALLALPATPADAATAACPDSIASAGFGDLTGLSAETVDAVDCLFDYGISKGTSATTFGPTADVARWQMALFLVRQAGVHGVTVPAAADQGFTDLTGLSTEAVDAVNQLKQLGITKGTSATTFDPFGDVERWQMALFLTRLLSAAGLTLPSGATGPFTDLTGVPADAVTAINQLNALGIAKGTSATTFDPMGNVKRWQMALFLTRVLDAGGVVYPGVTLTADVTTQGTNGTVKLTITVGTSGNAPAEGQRVDVFVAKDFNTDGSVKTYATDDVLDGGSYRTGAAVDPSVIDTGDEVADPDGVVSVNLTTTATTAHTSTVVAWIGNLNDAYSSTRTQAKLVVNWTAGADDVNISSDDDTTGADYLADAPVVEPTFATAPYGSSNTITLQVIDSDDDPLAQVQNFRILRTIEVDGIVTAQSSQDVTADATGKYTESHTFTDPSSTGNNQTVAKIKVIWDEDDDGSFTDETGVAEVWLVWDDDKATFTNASLSGPDAADQDGFATFTVTVTDQYGDPCSTGCLVRFDWTNDDAAGFESADQRTLNSSGKASITIAGPGTNAVASNDTVAVRIDADDVTAGWQDPGADDDTETVAWYDDAPNNLGAAVGIVVVDTIKASDSFIGVFGAANWKFIYDADDQFSILGAATTLSAFETALSDTDVITANYDRDGTAPDVSTWDITTNN